jgi:hypothetical protein
MKNETTLTTTANRYRALVDVNIRDAKTGRTKTYAKGSVIAAAAWKALSSSTRERFEPVARGGRKAVRMRASELPLDASGVALRFIGPDQLNLLTGETRELAEETAALWAQQTGLPFPGLIYAPYRADDHLTWFIAAQGLAANLPPMYATNGAPTRPCGARVREANGGYAYRTASLLKTRERLLAGRPVFAYDEATERLINEIQAD